MRFYIRRHGCGGGCTRECPRFHPEIELGLQVNADPLHCSVDADASTEVLSAIADVKTELMIHKFSKSVLCPPWRMEKRS